MTTDIKSIFITDAKSIGEFLVTPGQGYYIPPYQRNYAWGSEDITRLFEDILIGINQAKGNKDTITFLGTIIAIHDTNYTTINPVIHSEVPNKVMTIIDGQQRIATNAMLSIALHNSIRLAQSKLKASLGEKRNETEEPDKHFSWILEKSSELLLDLRDSYATDSRKGEDSYRYYPCIIRAYKDTWSSKSDSARYRSPIAHLIRDYIVHDSTSDVGKFTPKLGAKKERGWEHVEKAFNEIQKNCDLIGNSSTQRAMNKFGELIDIKEILNDNKLPNKEFWNEIIGYNPPEEIKSYVLQDRNQMQNNKEKTAYDCVCFLFRLIVFSFYLRHRVAAVIVSMRSEEDAFDMFESLNTTGQPLTAFETFQPKVIEWETLEKYKDSPSFDLINRIKEYLDHPSKPDDRQKVAAEMLVSFALLETGRKLGKKLNSQRRYLREEFDKVTNGDTKTGGHNFIQSMTDLAIFMQHGWVQHSELDRHSVLDFNSHLENSQIDEKEQQRIRREANEAIFSIRALHDLKHQITIAPLARFFQFALHQPAENGKIYAIEKFHQSIRATAAFSFLWRGAWGSTSDIDSHYRNIMNGKGSVPALARHLTDSDPCIRRYQDALVSILKEKGIQQKQEWVERASTTAIYRHNTIVTRFLLFCAMDDAAKFPGSKGHVIRGKQDSYPLLRIEQWEDKKHLTIEHIAPQKPAGIGDWSEDIYQDTDETVHYLGNLTLLPVDENSEINNTSWEKKLERYKSLSDPTLNSDSTNYIRFCSDIAAYDAEEKWSHETIKHRSENLAELAWDRLAPWLGLDLDFES